MTTLNQTPTKRSTLFSSQSPELLANQDSTSPFWSLGFRTPKLVIFTAHSPTLTVQPPPLTVYPPTLTANEKKARSTSSSPQRTPKPLSTPSPSPKPSHNTSSNPHKIFPTSHSTLSNPLRKTFNPDSTSPDHDSTFPNPAVARLSALLERLSVPATQFFLPLSAHPAEISKTCPTPVCTSSNTYSKSSNPQSTFPSLSTHSPTPCLSQLIPQLPLSARPPTLTACSQSLRAHPPNLQLFGSHTPLWSRKLLNKQTLTPRRHLRQSHTTSSALSLQFAHRRRAFKHPTV